MAMTVECLIATQTSLQCTHAVSDVLNSADFSSPIRKSRGIELTDEESRYIAVFGSFRSKIESFFGDMQTTFTRFSHTVVNRVSDKNIFALQFKLCCLLFNIKCMAALCNITVEQHHNFWMQDDFDFPSGDDGADSLQIVVTPNFKAKISDAKRIQRLQDTFLGHSIAGQDTEADHEMNGSENAVYEIQRILGHRGEGEAIEYHVLWKGYDASQATWEPITNFRQTRIIDEYQNSLRTF
ncbi:hypothetical protein BGZ73_008507 [Actinomortierella ambigua]|nr:hypothetical protein BGZ73_008507 [Actinomortierella ambigua]